MKIFKTFLLKYFGSLVSVYVYLKKKEKKVSYGKDNPEKKFYVIGQDDELGGLWWLVNKVLMHLWYSEDNGYIPVVDWQNFKNQYSSEDTIGKINVWEKFFLQPAGYSLEDINKSKYVIKSKQSAAPSNKYYMGQFYNDSERIDLFKRLFEKYVHFTDEVQIYLNNKVKEYLFERRVVGVLCRGTDYVKKRPSTHPIQPEPEDVIRDVKEVMKNYSCDYVFIATEDLDVLNQFKEEFGEHLLYEDQDRLSKSQIEDNQWLAKAKKKVLKNVDPFSSGLAYLTSTYILSKCTCFIGGRTGGTKGVLLMSDNFDFLKIYDLGYYE